MPLKIHIKYVVALNQCPVPTIKIWCDNVLNYCSRSVTIAEKMWGGLPIDGTNDEIIFFGCSYFLTIEMGPVR
jgi:hypothetical protein